MILYAVLPAYNDDNSIRYDVLPYNFKGTLKCYFSRNIHRGVRRGYNLCTRISQFYDFIKSCRLTEKYAENLQIKLSR